MIVEVIHSGVRSIVGTIRASRYFRSGFRLYRAALNGDKDKITALLVEKVKLDAIDPLGRDCLLGAFSSRNWSLFEWLLINGADLRPLLSILVRLSDPVPLLQLLDQLDRLAPLKQKMLGTAMVAMVTRPCTTVEILIRVGKGRNLVAALDHVLMARESCLSDSDILYAASAGNNEVIDCLVRHGAKLDWRNSYGETALTVAAAFGHHNVVKKLAEKGADIHHATNWLRYHRELLKTRRYKFACYTLNRLSPNLLAEIEHEVSFIVLGSTAATRAFSDSPGFCGGAYYLERGPLAFISLTAIPSYVRNIYIEDNPQYLRHYLCNLHWDSLCKIEVWLATPQEGGEFKMRRFEPMGDAAAIVDDFKFQVLQTFLWVSSTLSRMVCKENVRWTAWSCTGNCLG